MENRLLKEQIEQMSAAHKTISDLNFNTQKSLNDELSILRRKIENMEQERWDRLDKTDQILGGKSISEFKEEYDMIKSELEEKTKTNINLTSLHKELASNSETYRQECETKLVEAGHAIGILSEQLENLLNAIDSRGYHNDFKKQRSVLRDYEEIAKRATNEIKEYKHVKEFNEELIAFIQEITDWLDKYSSPDFSIQRDSFLYHKAISLLSRAKEEKQ